MTADVINKDTVTVLAQYADLSLSNERKEEILPILQSWLPAANALSLRMSSEEVREQHPGTVFTLGPRL